MRSILLLAIVSVPLLGLGQTPDIFDVSDVVAGAQRVNTTYFYSEGKWSDDSKNAGVHSVEIHCYKAFGFCEVAHAYLFGGQTFVGLDSFDILRWDAKELLAVDSSPICLVNNLRADFRTKKVSLSSTSKGVVKDEYCKDLDADPATYKTAFLMGTKDMIKQSNDEAAAKKEGKK